MMAKKKTAKKKVVVPEVVLPKGAKVKGASKKKVSRQGQRLSVREIETLQAIFSEVRPLVTTDEEGCRIVGIGHDTLARWKNNYPEFRQKVKDIKQQAKEEEDATYKDLVIYISEQMKREMQKKEKVSSTMKWWIGRADRIQKQRDDREERRERARVEDGFRERQLQIQELQNKVDEEREKRLLIEAQERKVWKEMASERRSNLLWAARQVVEQKVKTGVPAEEIAVSCEVRGAQISAVAKKYADHLASESKEEFVFGKHGVTQDEIENVDIWYEMAEKIRKKPGEFIKA